MRRFVAVSLLVLSAALSSAVCRGADEPPVLGDRFAGPFDVSFRPFAGAKLLERQTVNEVARFAIEDKKWLMIFSRMDLPEESPLKDIRIAGGATQAGYLSTAINKLRSADAKADVLRNEVIDLGDLRIGVLAAATHERDKPVLLQEALMEVTPKLYYTLAMTSPIADGGDAMKAPTAREAALAFKAVLDSIERVDQSRIKQEQDERLFRSRGLFAQWNAKKILGVLKPERFLRFKRDGRDVGYAYVVEQPADALPRAGQPDVLPPDPAAASGFRVGTRTHTLGEGGKVLDTESWMYISFDRRHEVWTNQTQLQDPAALAVRDKNTVFREVGASDHLEETVFDKNLNHDDFKELDKRSKNDPRAQPFRVVDRYRLKVQNEGRAATAQPVDRDLPPFYLPQALGVLLPRIVPVGSPTGYMFAIYNSDTRQVMFRYIDVVPESDVQLDGRTVHAAAVSERIGFNGQPTTHYLTRKGEYLGSVNPAAKLEILPTDRATLTTIWKDIDLHEPSATK